MREILFRGKHLDDGKWVYGYYYADKNETPFIMSPFKDPGDSKYRAMAYVVDPNTIGQYTGLEDKNGKRIFEGDILKSDEGGSILVLWSHLLARFEKFGDALS